MCFQQAAQVAMRKHLSMLASDFSIAERHNLVVISAHPNQVGRVESPCVTGTL
jgi:hypothetical protein